MPPLQGRGLPIPHAVTAEPMLTAVNVCAGAATAYIHNGAGAGASLTAPEASDFAPQQCQGTTSWSQIPREAIDRGQRRDAAILKRHIALPFSPLAGPTIAQSLRGN